jgi:hypothetical protein
MGKHITICLDCRCGCVTYTAYERAKHLKSKIHKDYLKRLERGLIEDMDIKETKKIE